MNTLNSIQPRPAANLGPRPGLVTTRFSTAEQVNTFLGNNYAYNISGVDVELHDDIEFRGTRRGALVNADHHIYEMSHTNDSITFKTKR